MARLMLMLWALWWLTPRAAAQTTVDLMLAGRPTQAEVYGPAETARGAVVLSHGFMRTRATMVGRARMLAEMGVLAVVPNLPFVTDSRDNACALTDLVAQLRAGRSASGRAESPRSWWIPRPAPNPSPSALPRRWAPATCRCLTPTPRRSRRR